MQCLPQDSGQHPGVLLRAPGWTRTNVSGVSNLRSNHLSYRDLYLRRIGHLTTAHMPLGAAQFLHGRKGMRQVIQYSVWHPGHSQREKVG